MTGMSNPKVQVARDETGRAIEGLGSSDIKFTMSADGIENAPRGNTASEGAPVEVSVSPDRFADEVAQETQRVLAPRADAWRDAVIGALARFGPRGWVRCEAVIALAVGSGVARVDWYDRQGESLRSDLPEDVLDLVREQRVRESEHVRGPWWRLIVRATAEGGSEFEYDYGEEPFPDDQLLLPQAYLADLQAFPRARVPVWLAAYVRQEQSQRRSARQAAARARATGVAAARAADGLPELAVMWARWAALSAAFVAGGLEWGPRVFPSMGIFEGDRRSGSTLYLLPGDRAVLSGGVWNAPDLEAAYNGTGVLPDYYAGAPEWVANQVLNPRAANGLLSFCFWWDRGRWYRGESAEVEQLTMAMPGIRTAEAVVDAVCAGAASGFGAVRRPAAAVLVSAAEGGAVTRDLLTEAFGSRADIDGAWYQLSLAGLVDASGRRGAREVNDSLCGDRNIDGEM
ncbi:hypothetical protein [Nocardia caishijiensis]|uniref:Uncharacterized protein n=1 Tax=Nocardia caishijiensis TaxID=184756 RepID=A0ABQ6YR66_9NOCA|nr:hypothetical protein [Nocardia caishijiensis]KAF0848280.1 hypothetical protein FNL39_102428 [Nocardia caishijiensis]